MLVFLALTCLGAQVRGTDAVPDRQAAFQSLLQQASTAPVADRLRSVNRFFNAMRYASDRVLYGREDHWSTPDELLSRGAGDCEDLAIGKYFALRRLGTPAHSLQITYVRGLRRTRPHMVLVYRGADAPPVVLDSRSDAVLPLDQRRDLVPVFGFNERRVTVLTPGGVPRSFAHAGRWRIRHWDSVLRRVPAAQAGSRTPPLVRASLYR